jgi:aryl-alcohol dehydrogenase-like predicted oxidoreductase
MEKRKCGSTGLELPALGVGCWAFGGGEYWGSQAQGDVDAVVRGAIDAGCDYFDTAEAYNNGASETSLGVALKGLRARAIVGTKVSPSNCYPAALREHCEASLRRLCTDYIDLYMIHWPIHPHSIRHFSQDEQVISNPPKLADALDTLARLKQEGKIRHVGVSNFGVARLAEAMKFATIAVNELPYSLLTRAIEVEALPQCRAAAVGVIGYMTLLQGLLADIYPTLNDVPAWQRRTRHFHHKSCDLCRHGEQGAEAETDAALAAIRAIAKRENLTMPQIALKWALAGDGITCALVGARNTAELQDNIDAASTPLPPPVVSELNAATAPLLKKLGKSFDYYESTENDRTR